MSKTLTANEVPSIGASASPYSDRTADQVLSVDVPTTAFGELSVAESQPMIQIEALYGIRFSDVETFSDGTGAVATEFTGRSNEFKMSTGVTIGSYGVLRSRRSLRYRPGEGVVGRFTLRFTNTGVALSRQAGGFLGVGTEISFGYNNTTFGCLLRTGGKLESRLLTLTVGAGGAETATVTLDGVAFPIVLASGSTAATGSQLAAAIYGSGASRWLAFQNGNTVMFLAQAVGSKSATYSFTSTGTAAGTFSQVIAGAAVTDTFIAQADWNVDPMDGTGPSGQTLDTNKGNVYQIKYQYLGYGMISFFIENSNTGKFQLVHQVRYANNNVSPSINLPTLKMGFFTASLGSTTALTLYSASAAGFVEGRRALFRNPRGKVQSKSGVSTTLVSVFSIRVRRTFNSVLNLSEVLPWQFTAGADGTKPVEAELIINGTLAGTPNWSYESETQSIVEIDTSAGAVTLGATSERVAALALGKAGETVLDLSNMGIRLSVGDILTVAAKASSGTTDITVGLVWVED